MKAALAEKSIDRFRERTQDKKLLAADFDGTTVENLQLIPTQIIKRLECRQSLKNISEDLKSMATILGVSEGWRDDGDGEDPVAARVRHVAQVKNVDIKIRNYLKKSETVWNCLDEYSETLKNVMAWRETAKTLAEDFRNEAPGEVFNFTAEVQDIDRDQRQIEGLLKRYAAAKITKQQLLDQFDVEKRSSTDSDHIAHVNLFVDRILQYLTEPLRQRIIKMRKNLQSSYEQSLKRALQLDPYVEDGVLSSWHPKVERMKIWRIPTANLEFPQNIQDKAREFWNVWNRETPMHTFVRKEANQFIAQGLSEFCHPLIERLDNFEQQLQLNKNKLTTSMTKIQNLRISYVESQRIDHRFVLANFLAIDVYFAQLKHQNVKQIEAYQTTQFL